MDWKVPLLYFLDPLPYPIMLMTKKSYHSMEEQGGGGGEFLDVDKGEHVNKVTLPGFEAWGVCYPVMVVLMMMMVMIVVIMLW